MSKLDNFERALRLSEIKDEIETLLREVRDLCADTSEQDAAEAYLIPSINDALANMSAMINEFDRLAEREDARC